MSEAVTAELVRASDIIPIPVGCQPRQVKLARLSLERPADSEESLSDMLKEAGYADITAEKAARRTLNSVGVQRAVAMLQHRQADRARSIVGVGLELLESADKDELSSRDKYFLGLKALETGTAMGENTEQKGSADAWRSRIARVYRLSARLTELRLLSPPPAQAAAAERHAKRQAQRMGY